MKKEVVKVPEGTTIPEIIKILGERAKNSQIFIDMDLINKEKLIERNLKGVYYLNQDGFNIELDSNYEESGEEPYWFLWYLNKPKTRELEHYTTFFEEELHIYVKKE